MRHRTRPIGARVTLTRQTLNVTRIFNHEAHVRYGDTGNANLHYCDWIRSWTDTCLKVYGEIAVKNPGYLEQFE